MKAKITPVFSLGLSAIAVVMAANGAFAQISYSGDLSPADPSTWTSGTTATIGSVANGSGSLTVNSGALVQAGTLYVGGTSASGTLTVNAGGTVSVSDWLSIGNVGGASGMVIVDGGTLDYGSASGYYGGFGINTGSFVIKNGGIVNSNNSIASLNINNGGQVLIDGAGSQWNAASGNAAQIFGALTVSNGGRLTTGGAYLGRGARVKVDGQNSLWDLSTYSSYGLYMSGNEPSTTLEITGGGAVTVRANMDAKLYATGDTTTAKVGILVDGAHSLFQVDGNLIMQAYSQWYYTTSASAVLTVSNGATANIGGGIGLGSNSTYAKSVGDCAIVVDGGTLNYTGSFGVGQYQYGSYASTGSVTVKNGGVINQTYNLSQIWMAPGSAIVVEGAGSQWNAASLNQFGIYGTVDILEGGYMRTGRAVITSGSTVQVDGSGSRWVVDGGSGSYGELGIYTTTDSSALEITSGGFVSVSSALQGMIFSGNTNGTAQVLVSGANSRWSLGGNLKMAYSSQYSDYYTPLTSLVVSNAGAVTVGQRFELYKNTCNYTSGANTVTVDATSALTVGSTSGQLGWVTVGQDGYVSLANHSTLNAQGNLAVTDNGVLAINTPSVVSVSGNMTVGANATVTVVMNEAATALQVGGNLTNSGTIKLTASDSLTTIFTPISVAGTWADTDTAKYIAYGGTWDNDTKTFTPAAVQAVTTTSQTTVGGQTLDGYVASVSTGVDSGARLWVGATDSDTPAVMLNFSTSTTSTDIGVVSCETTESQASSLVSAVAASGISDASDRGSWVFYLDGQLDGEVMLGIALSSYDPRTEALSIWHYDTDTGEWALYTTTDYFVSDGYAYFTVDGFSGYGIVATAIPEPSAIACASVIAALVLLRRRRARA